MTCYTLDENHKPVLAKNEGKWSAWMSKAANRRVALTETDLYEVSTVFTGYGGLLFQTMVFERADDDGKSLGAEAVEFEKFLYRTWEEALHGHAATVTWVKAREAEGAGVAKNLLDAAMKGA